MRFVALHVPLILGVRVLHFINMVYYFFLFSSFTKIFEHESFLSLVRGVLGSIFA